jgi:hypothetical protein
MSACLLRKVDITSFLMAEVVHTIKKEKACGNHLRKM